MPTPAIVAQGLGKRFALADLAPSRAHQALDDLLWRPLRRNPAAGGEFWAVRDVSFEVMAGEVVALLGRNGAGKSVLLKLLSRIMRPTTGRAEIWGRVAPLLELGTGFQPDLTGRENIRLNGTILGMRLSEIRKRTDAIVAFSGVERFLDMPVKHYSSGMRMRLAFSVAAHLDRDVFFLDEVLAVGDLDFQDRCLGRIRSLAQQGRTIVLVNHGLDVVEGLCSRALLLDGGRLIADGSPRETLAVFRKLRERNEGGAS